MVVHVLPVLLFSWCNTPQTPKEIVSDIHTFDKKCVAATLKSNLDFKLKEIFSTSYNSVFLKEESKRYQSLLDATKTHSLHPTLKKYNISFLSRTAKCQTTRSPGVLFMFMKRH
jgi:hypothetical protein